jgi:dTMP kinase
LTAVELLLHYARSVTLPLVLGRVVICDRYIYDAFADWAAYFGERAERSGAARLLRLLSPRPELAYWLQVPTHLAQSRSTDLLLESFVDSQTAAYERMTREHGLRRVEGSRDEEELADELAYQVLGRYFDRYRTVLNQVFLKNPGQWR